MNTVIVMIVAAQVQHLVHAEMEAARSGQSVELVTDPKRPSPQDYGDALAWFNTNCRPWAVEDAGLRGRKGRERGERAYQTQPFYAKFQKHKRRE